MMAAAWSRPEHERAGTELLVMLHGYGSSEQKLLPLFSALPPHVTGVALRGHFDVGGTFGWFLLDPLLGSDFTEVLDSVNKVFAWLDPVLAGGGFSGVSLLGFSQGMALATTLLRLRPRAFRAAVGLSGFVLEHELLALTDEPEAAVPFFWGRDVRDGLIPADAVRYTAAWLQANTLLTARTYPGMGHRIGRDEIRDVGIFLARYLAR
ncbi:alpha/beta hydrolase [Arthrobacter sp. GCM10027362]|uniref:alpha/beta hydrolase n=1 Tax=Arthrobacter sp. GCM10027362 TaxID=3273379 RepID=UPI0036344648